MARRELGPATLIATQAVLGALRPSDTTLLVACSGGSDSLALAVAARAAARRADRALLGVVVDHGLQPGSDVVAARARNQLAGIGYDEALVVKVRVGPAGGPEAGARSARYAALDRVAAQRGATVLLGHTQDDQAETVLLGLVRGSGSRSLAGMAPRRGVLLRPFLELRRELLITVCEEAGLEVWSDPHNADPAYARARVRHRVLPVLEDELGPGVTEALARTARLLRIDADHLDAEAQEAATGEVELDCARTADQPVAIRSRVVRRWLRERGAFDLSLDHVAAVEQLLTDWRGQRWIGVPGLRIRRVDDRLVGEPIGSGPQV